MAESRIKIKASVNEIYRHFKKCPSQLFYIKYYNSEFNGVQHYKENDNEAILFEVLIRHNEIGKRTLERKQPYTLSSLEKKLSDLVKEYEQEQKISKEKNEKLKQPICELQSKMQIESVLKVVSAEYVGNYNDTIVYNVELSLNGERVYATLERKYNDRDASHKWEVFSDSALKDKEIDYIIKTISKNPPVMSIDASPKIYESLLADEIEMEK